MINHVFTFVAACKNVPGFVPYATGGDGDAVPLCKLKYLFPSKLIPTSSYLIGYIGWWPSGSSVVVVHEGTDPTQLCAHIFPLQPTVFPDVDCIFSLSLLTDAEVLFGSLDSTLFPTVPSTVSVHTGFRDAHAATATTVLSTVKEIIAAKGATKVTVGEYLVW